MPSNDKIDFSQEQRMAIETVDCNVVVSAGAGAGKTRVLTERFVEIVRQGKAEIGEILTMTFTRKAAAEMLGRIQTRLSELPQRSALTESKTPALNSAQIMTIDSFCSMVARDYFDDYDLPPGTAPDEEEVKRLSEEVVLKWILKHQEDSLIRKMAYVYSFETFWKQWLTPISVAAFRLVNPTDFSQSADLLLKSIPGKLKGLCQKMERESEGLPSFPPKPGRDNDFYRLIKRIRELSERFGSSRFDEADQLLDFFSEAETPIPKVYPKETKSIPKEWVDRGKILHRQLSEFYHRTKMLSQSDEYSRFYALLDDLQTEVLNERRRRGVVTFADIADIAVDLLKSHLSLRRFYKKKYKYIMIDEFQDNNRQQKELAYLLAEKEGRETEGIPAADELAEKLFFVGDEKQSIYRFRGADVSVFRELKTEVEKMEPGKGKLIDLSTNYRSEQGLIEFFNRFFPFVFNPSSGEDDAGAPVSDGTNGNGDGNGTSNGDDDGSEPPCICYTPIGFAPSKRHAPQKASFCFYEAPKPTAKEGQAESSNPSARPDLSDEEVAGFTAGLIQSWVNEGVEANRHWVREGEGFRPCEYRDFALLFRSASKQHLYEKELLKKRIPFQSQTVTSFYTDSVFNDYYYLFLLLLYPTDPVLLASVLRSPLSPLSDEAVFDFLLSIGQKEGKEVEKDGEKSSGSGDEEGEIGKNSFKPPLFNGLLFRSYNPDSDDALERFFACIQQWRSWVDRLPIAVLVDRIWFDYGLRYHYLTNPKAESFLDHFDYLRNCAMDADKKHQTLEQFTAVLTEAKATSAFGAPSKLENPRRFSSNENAVQLMTVHASKGLEFPIVIVADAGHSNAGRGNRAPFSFSKKEGLWVGIPKNESVLQSGSMKWEEAGEEAEEREENKRLLYVAFTRAMNHLIVVGKENRNASDPDSNFLASVKKILDSEAFQNQIAEIADCFELERGEVTAEEREEKGKRQAGQGPKRLPLVKDTSPLPPRRLSPIVMNPSKLERDFSRLPAAASAPVAASTAISAPAATADFAPEPAAAAAAAGMQPESAPAAAAELAPEPAAPASAAGTQPESAAAADLRRSFENFKKSIHGRESSFGDLCHGLMEMAMTGRPLPAPDSPDSLFPKATEAFSAGEAKAAKCYALHLVQRYLASEDCRRLLGGAVRQQAECPFALVPSEALAQRIADEFGVKPDRIEGRADLVIEYPDTTLVVDYKTDSEPDDRKYELQLAAYREAFETITGQPTRVQLVYLQHYL